MIKKRQIEFMKFEKIDEFSEFYQKSRLDNNIIEGYFKHLKHNLLRLSERKFENKLVISQVSIQIYRELQAKYKEFKYDMLLNIGESKSLAKETSSFELVEKWSEKKSKKGREKSYYYNHCLELSESKSTQTSLLKPEAILKNSPDKTSDVSLASQYIHIDPTILSKKSKLFYIKCYFLSLTFN